MTSKEEADHKTKLKADIDALKTEIKEAKLKLRNSATDKSINVDETERLIIAATADLADLTDEWDDQYGE